MAKVSDKDVIETKEPEADEQPETEEKTTLTEEAVTWYKRQDLWVWVGGNLFIALIIGLMFAIGQARGWSADSGYTHNESATSQDRFLPEPDPPEEGVRGRYGPEATGRWYYWKLKPENLTVWSHLFPWVCYVSHQILIWTAIYRAQMAKALEPAGRKRYRPRLSTYGWVSFAVNLAFHLLHLTQTHVTYDATAQDVSIATSQASVIMMLTVVFMMEYRDRGLFFGWPLPIHKNKISQTLRLNYGPINVLRRYHGYAFAWASIYTFWYHPMENTWGHAMGFIYTWLVMLQGSLMYTPLHLNRWWRLLLEAFVIVHGGLVAAQTGGPDLGGTRLWPMFVFGFLLAFVVTQVFSLPIWDYLHAVFHLVPFLAYIGVVIWCYSWIRDAQGRAFVRMQEIIRIPSIYYLFFLVGWLVLMAFLAIERRVHDGRRGLHAGEPASPTARALWLGGAMLVYGVHIGLAIICEYADWQLGLITLMIMFVGIFMVGVIVSSMFLRQVIPYRMKPPVGRAPHYVEMAEADRKQGEVNAAMDGHQPTK